MTQQTRYGDTYTPGEQAPPAHEIVRFDPAVADDYDAKLARKRELKGMLTAVDNERVSIETNLGALVAEGGEGYKESTDRLAELRAEAEALEAGIDYLNGRLDLLKRTNYWLTSR